MTLSRVVADRLNKPDRPELNKKPFFPDTDYQHVVLIILDGVSRRVFETATMPFIRTLQAKGAYYTNCVTSFPTMTASAHTSINTGSYPETHNVGIDLGNGRPVLGNDIYLSAALKKAGLTSSCVADPTFKGAFSYLSVEYFGHSISKTGEMARWSFETFRPSFLTVTFYAPDTLAHAYGPGHEHVYTALTDIDAEVERLVDAMEKSGGLDKSLLMIASDHGQVGSDWPVYGECDVFGRLGVDFTPNPGGRTITLNDPTEKQLEQWLVSDMTLKILSPTDVKMLGHNCQEDRYVVCLKENYTWKKTHNVSIHGGLSKEERNVPLVLSGYGVKPGIYGEIAEGIDLALTATALLGGVHLPTYQGRILGESFIWDNPIASADLVEWRRKRELWIEASKFDNRVDAGSLLLERRRLEQEYYKAILTKS